MSATALGYQMMFEGVFLNSMIDAEKRGNYLIASSYAKLYCQFLDIQEENWPKMPASTNGTADENSREFQKYYFALFKEICKKATSNLKDVRKKYGPKGNIPT